MVDHIQFGAEMPVREEEDRMRETERVMKVAEGWNGMVKLVDEGRE